MAKLTLTDLDSLSNETTAIANINANSAAIETALENTLSRDGTGPNSMDANLDMNGNRIQNLPVPVGPTEPLRLGDAGTLIAGEADLLAAVAAAEDAQAAAEAAQALAESARNAAQIAETNAETAEANAESALIALQTIVDNANYRFETFTGTGAQTAFTLSDTAAETNTFVFVNGTYQNQSTWSISGNTLTFSVAPALSATIEVMIGAQTVINTTTIGGVSGLQSALDAKANLASPTFSGTVTLPTLTVTNDISITDDLTVGDNATVTGNVTVSGYVIGPVGSETLPGYTFSGDLDTGMWRSASNVLNFSTAGVERLEIDATSADFTVNVFGDTDTGISKQWRVGVDTNTCLLFVDDLIYVNSNGATALLINGDEVVVSDTWTTPPGTEKMYVQGDLTVSDDYVSPSSGTNSSSARGVKLNGSGSIVAATHSGTVMALNRQGTDGNILTFNAQGNQEGVISVSGAVVTYGSFCGAHWSQLKDKSTPNIPKGTVVESIDELAEWEGTNEHLAKFKVSDTPGSKAVYGVFSNWDEDGDAMIASLGAFVIRVQWNEVLEVGDLLESAGNGTARKQWDDIVRNKTIAKVTSTKVIETYKDGSFLVPCTLHCG